MALKKKSARVRAVVPASRAALVFTGGMPRTLGMRLVAQSRKRVVVEMPIRELHRNRNGLVNGGAIMALADATGACGAVANMPPGYRTGTLESKTNFFAPGLGPLLKAVSIPLHIGRTTSVWQTTITNSGNNKRVAIVTQTQIYLPPPAEAKAD